MFKFDLLVAPTENPRVIALWMDNLIFIFATQGFTVTNAAHIIPLLAFPCCDYEWVLWSLTHILSSASFSHTSLWAVLDKPPATQSRGLHSRNWSSWWWSDLLGAACVCVCLCFHIKSGIHRCSGTTVTTRLFLDDAAHTWASLQQGNCVSVHVTWGSVSEELTNIQQCPGGETESMESKGRGKLWKIKLGLKYNGWPQPLTQNRTYAHTHKQTDTTVQQPWHLHIKKKMLM